MVGGTVVTNLNRPADLFSMFVYMKIIELKQKILLMHLTVEEINFIQKWFASGNTSTPDHMSDQRRIQIMNLVSILTGISLKINIMPTFKSRFDRCVLN